MKRLTFLVIAFTYLFSTVSAQTAGDFFSLK